MILRSTTGRLSSASSRRIACTRRRSLAGSSIRSKGCTVSRIEGHPSSAPGSGVFGSAGHRAGPGRERGKIEPMAIQVFVLDDHELVRTGLRTLLESEDDMEVVGEAGTAVRGLQLIRELKPNVAILDVRLPDGNGIEVCREIQS